METENLTSTAGPLRFFVNPGVIGGYGWGEVMEGCVWADFRKQLGTFEIGQNKKRPNTPTPNVQTTSMFPIKKETSYFENTNNSNMQIIREGKNKNRLIIHKFK